MVFELDRFVKDPDAQQLLGCTKKDLCSVDNHYGIAIQGSIRKEELRTNIINGMVEQVESLSCPLSRLMHPLRETRKSRMSCGRAEAE